MKTFDFYIARPYSHPHSLVRFKRYQLANAYLAESVHQKKCAFSPITHSHVLHNYQLPTDFNTWSYIDLRVLANCEELHVLTEPGWKESKGVQAEIQFAKDNDIPIRYFNSVTWEELDVGESAE